MYKEGVFTAYIPKNKSTDYGYTWWAEGWKGYDRTLLTQNGRFGAALAPGKGKITHFGMLKKQTAQQALRADNSEIYALPPLDFTASVIIDGIKHGLCGMEPMEDYVPSYATEPHDTGIYNRILESGRTVQRNEMMLYRFEDADGICGRAELLLMPESCALSFELFGYEKQQNVTLELSINAPNAVDKGNYIASGFDFYPAKGEMTLQGNYIAVKRALTVPYGRFDGVCVRIFARGEQPDDIALSAVCRTPHSGKLCAVERTEQGYYTVSQDGLYGCHGGGEDAITDENLHTYDSIELTFTNSTCREQRTVVSFVKNMPLSITGLCPLLRTLQGEPIGVQVQLTKNWHCFPTEQSIVSGSAPRLSPKRHFEGIWFHGYAVITVPANTTLSLLYTCTFGTWGKLYPASHSQLCLAGWGGGQQWETCAVGSFGESFCYDIARSWTWCCMGDICTFGLYSRIDGKKYDWTGNTGGGDFLFYEQNGQRVELSAMHTDFRKQGPCQTEVDYHGRCGDIAVDIGVRMGRTDDFARATHIMHYHFDKDVTFDRMVFYQCGSDTYNYDFWDKLAYGDENGLIKEYTLADDFDIPKKGEPGRQQLLIDEAPCRLWVSLHGTRAASDKALGNKVMLVRAYSAYINGKRYTKPSLSLRTSNIMDWWFGALPELVAPAECGSVIKAGSDIVLVTEYINTPARRSDFYPDSPYIAALPDDSFDTWRMGAALCRDERVTLSAKTGKVLSLLPIRIACENNTAELDISGGIGYSAVTFTGLTVCTGVTLRQYCGACPQELDQQYEGNDYWQAWHNPDDDTYELTYNIYCGTKHLSLSVKQ